MTNTINHFESLKNILIENQVFPILKYWNKYETTHFNYKPNRSETKKIIDEMKNTLGNKSGLYAYYKDGRLLYLGKGNPLFNRIRSHFNEAHNTSNPEDLWFSFFNNHSGSLVLYWIEIDDENLEKEFEAVRVAYESILNVLDKPEFENYKQNRIKRRGSKKGEII